MHNEMHPHRTQLRALAEQLASQHARILRYQQQASSERHTSSHEMCTEKIAEQQLRIKQVYTCTCTCVQYMYHDVGNIFRNADGLAGSEGMRVRLHACALRMPIKF